MSRQFYRVLETLREKSSCRQRGIEDGKCLVQQADVADLLYHFDRLDEQARHFDDQLRHLHSLQVEQMDVRLEKYFATDGDKFLFWIADDGYISFEKFSVIFSDLQTDETEVERIALYNESRKLPVLAWGALNACMIQ